MGTAPIDYLRILYRRRWLAIAVVTVAAVATAFFNAYTVPLYDAQATLLIDADRPNVVTFQEVLTEGPGQDGYYQTQVQLLASRALALRTAKALSPETRQLLGDPGDEAAADILQYGLSVVPVRGTRMVTLRYRGPDPDAAVDIVNTHAREYIEESLDLRFRASREATDWLDTQLAEERRRVEQSESALQAYREQHDAISLGAGQDIVVQKLTDLSAAVTRAKTTRIEKEAQYRELLDLQQRGLAVEASPAILSNPFVQQLKGDLARLQREYAQLADSLGDRHPTLLAKRTEVDTTERRLAAEVSRVVDSRRNEYQGALAEERSLTGALEEQKREALALDRRGIEYAAMEREAESVRQVYQSLLQRAKETSVSGELRATNIRIIDRARRPGEPAFPRPMFNMVLALLAGSLLAIGLVFGLEYVDDRARTPDDVRERVKLPVLGLIPEVRTGADRTAALLRPDTPPSLVEAVRAMRTVLLSGAKGDGPHTIVVASAHSGEGKSFVSSSLAIALAQAQYRVLLIDTDMRRPGLHRQFGQAAEPGLSTVLAGNAALADILRPTPVPGLTVLTAGTPSPHAPELLGSARFAELFQVLQEHFEWVILDSPPSLSVTDASVIGRLATGVIFTIASDRTSTRAARLAIEELRSAGANVLGAVLTRADLQQHPFYFSPYVRENYGPDASASPAAVPAPAPGRVLGGHV